MKSYIFYLISIVQLSTVLGLNGAADKTKSTIIQEQQLGMVTLSSSDGNTFKVPLRITLVSADGVSFEINTILVENVYTIVDMLFDLKDQPAAFDKVDLPIDSTTLKDVLEVLKRGHSSKWYPGEMVSFELTGPTREATQLVIDNIDSFINNISKLRVAKLLIALDYLNFNVEWNHLAEIISSHGSRFLANVFFEDPIFLNRFKEQMTSRAIELLNEQLHKHGLDEVSNSKKLMDLLTSIVSNSLFKNI